MSLFVCPVGVQYQCNSKQSREQNSKMKKSQIFYHRIPVENTHPPHVVSKNHAAVKQVDHNPLVCLPEEGISTASLGKQEQRECTSEIVNSR